MLAPKFVNGDWITPKRLLSCQNHLDTLTFRHADEGPNKTSLISTLIGISRLFPGPIRNLDIRQPSSVEMEGVSMESIKASVRRASEFLQSLVFPSHTRLDEPLAAEDPVAKSSLEGLSLSPRVFNCLWRADIRNIETVISMSDKDLLNIRGFGIKSLTELKERLATCKESGGGG